MSIEHSTMQHDDVHEPKHITTSTLTDSGKVITSSSSTTGVSEFRQLSASEITDVVHTMVVYIPGVDVGKSILLSPGFSGSLLNATLCMPAVMTGDNSYSVRVNSLLTTGGSTTVAGVDTSVGSSHDMILQESSFSSNDYIEISVDGAVTTPGDVYLTLQVTRS